jgi:hypothetical protein
LKSTVLDKAYKDEHDADVKERILLVRRVLSDQQHIESVAQELLHKSRAWSSMVQKIQRRRIGRTKG